MKICENWKSDLEKEKIIEFTCEAPNAENIRRVELT